MALLKIYGVIVDERESAVLSWMGEEHTTLSEISDFIQTIPDSDDTIDVLINSRGGSVSDGWGIYDVLRSSGKKITATVEGVCASMASVVYMAAPKEARFAEPHSMFCIHEPRIPAYGIDRDATADELSRIAEELRIENRKFIDLYAERTGAEAERIESLMKEDKEITAEEAKEYGIVGVIKTPNTAKKTDNQINFLTMKKNVIAKLLSRAKALLEGVVSELRLTTAAGVELIVETDADDPKVGDNATPDGEHTLDDGRVVVVVDGVITEIREREEEEPTEEDMQQMAATIESLTNEVAALRRSQRTEAENEILGIVAKAGGIDWLKKVAVSKRAATTRTQNVGSQVERVSRISQELAELKKNRK